MFVSLLASFKKGYSFEWYFIEWTILQELQDMEDDSHITINM